MRYYCEHCKTEYKFAERVEGAITYDPDDMCPVCGNDDPSYELHPIPDYETPEQYEQRTGSPYPDSGAVWMRFADSEDDENAMWAIYHHGSVKGLGNLFVVAEPSVPPPKNWRPQ